VGKFEARLKPRASNSSRKMAAVWAYAYESVGAQKHPTGELGRRINDTHRSHNSSSRIRLGQGRGTCSSQALDRRLTSYGLRRRRDGSAISASIGGALTWTPSDD
jgi:hypothetical protein